MNVAALEVWRQAPPIRCQATTSVLGGQSTMVGAVRCTLAKGRAGNHSGFVGQTAVGWYTRV